MTVGLTIAANYDDSMHVNLVCSYRVNWGDGSAMDYYYGHDRPGPQSMNHVYAKSGTYKLEIALFQTNTYYGSGYFPTVTVF